MAAREDRRPKVHRRSPAHSEYDQHQVTVTATVQPQLMSLGAGPSVIFSQSVSNRGASKSFDQSLVTTKSLTESTNHNLTQTIGGARPKQLLNNYGTRSNFTSANDLMNNSNNDTPPDSGALIDESGKCQIGIRICFEVHGIKKVHNSIEWFGCESGHCMKWKYVMSSDKQISTCNDILEKTYRKESPLPLHTEYEKLPPYKGNVFLRRDNQLYVGFQLTDKVQARQIANQVLALIFNKMELTVETYNFKKNEIKKAVEQIKRTVSKIAHVDAINTDVYIVFQSFEREQVKRLLNECIDCKEERMKEERISLGKKLSKFAEEIKHRLFANRPDLTVKLQPSHDSLICILGGTETAVMEGKDMLRRYENELKVKRVIFTKGINEALLELLVGNRVNDLLNGEHPDCFAEQEQNKILIYGFVDETKLTKACLFVGNMIKECMPIPLCEDLRKNGTDIIKNHFRTKFKDKLAVHIDSSWRLHLIGFTEAVTEAKEELEKMKECGVSLPAQISYKGHKKEETEYYQLLVKVHSPFMEKSVLLNNIAKQFNVNINLQQKQYRVEIKGPTENVKEALKELQAIGNDICSEYVLIDNQEAVIYFTRDQNNDYMDRVERNYDVLLQKEVVFRTDEMTVTKQLFPENIILSDLSGRKLIVEMNHWDDIQASFKVKPIKRGQHGGRFVRNSSHVTMGVPGWVNGQQSEESELERCIRTLLTKASCGKEKAVALPLAPIERWPFNEYMHCFLKSCVHWLLVKSDILPTSVLLFTDSQNHFQRTDTYTEECIINELKELQKKPKAIEINVIKGQLNQTEADVLVNTTAPKLDLSNGKVSSALSKAAGSKLQQECRKLYPNGITPDTVAVTDGYNLKCKQVFHITLPPVMDDQKTDIESIRKAMLLCLKTASDNGHETIAFPVIGTGNLLYPVETVVPEMFVSVERHRVECPDTKLEEVRFVIFPKDTVLFKIFQEQEEKSRHFMKEEKSKLEPCCEVKFKITGMKKNVLDAKAELESNHPKVKRKFSLSKDVNNLEIYENGNLVIRVYEANIIAVPAEGIVNAANQDLKHVGGVARFIAKAAGESLLADCEQVIMDNKGPLKVSAVVCTTAGNLDFKYVIHAVGPRWSEYKPITKESLKQCSDDLKHTVISCLRKAESIHLKSLVMSTISSGAFGVPKEVCAVQYARAILEFSENRCTSLHEIHIVDKNHEMIDIVQKTFSAMITERKPAPFSLSVFVEPSIGQVALADGKNNNTSSDELFKFTGRDNPNSYRDEVKQEMSNTARAQSPGEQSMQPGIEVVNKDEAAADVHCVICMDKVTDSKTLKCGHIFCTECIDGYFRVKKVCPTCGKVCGTITGDQPVGSMEISKSSRHLKGFEHAKSLVIIYRFPDGNQRPDHPNPGALYKGIARSAYLPDTTEGREICAMLKVAFERRLVFTIGHSRTTGRDGVITWNDIHHKTDIRPNTQFGYPDDTYLQRVREELEVKGVTTEDLEMEFIKKLGKDQFKETIN